MQQESASSIAPVPLYRLGNPKSSAHFYTIDPNEVKSAQAQGYTLEGPTGIAGYVFATQVNSTVPVWRLKNGRDYFYTANANEVKSAQSHYEYTLEGNGSAAFYTYALPQSLVGAAPPKGYTVYPFYRLTNGITHFYTANADNKELVAAQKQYGYVAEGLAFFVLGPTS